MIDRSDRTRIERDTMGEMEVPAEALWGASTQRAVLNFPVSGTTVDVEIVHACLRVDQMGSRASEPGAGGGGG